MSRGSRALDFMHKGGHRVNGAIVGSGPKLRHQEEVEAFNVGVDMLGDDLLK